MFWFQILQQNNELMEVAHVSRDIANLFFIIQMTKKQLIKVLIIWTSVSCVLFGTYGVGFTSPDDFIGHVIEL